jgi:hypothetical protein
MPATVNRSPATASLQFLQQCASDIEQGRIQDQGNPPELLALYHGPIASRMKGIQS